MARDDDDDAEDDLQGASHEPRECMPCRGSGRVISNLGGAPAEVACPWCDGAGLRLAQVDAQARWPAAGETQVVAEPADGTAV